MLKASDFREVRFVGWQRLSDDWVIDAAKVDENGFWNFLRLEIITRYGKRFPGWIGFPLHTVLVVKEESLP